MKRLALALALVVCVPACKGDFFDPNPRGSGPPQPPSVQVAAENVQLLPGAADAIRFSFSPLDDSVRVRITRSSSEGRVIACPLSSIDDALPDLATCLPDLPNGVREPFTRSGLGGVALIREGDAITIGIRLDYAEGDRRLAVRIPIVERPAGASACKDNGCNPFFELTPVKGGDFTATATWTGGEARMEMLEGRVLAKAFSATGIPYRRAGQAQGPSGLTVTARLGAPSEYALAFTNESSADLRRIEIRAVWP